MQDAFAYRSQQKARRALEAGVFDDEIVPVRAVGYDGDQRVYRDFTVDELPRPDTTLEGLARLPPAFAPGRQRHRRQQLAALRRRRGGAGDVAPGRRRSSGSCRSASSARSSPSASIPEIMGIGPLPAVQKLLAKTGLSIADIDLFELNEAFASQSVYCQRELGIPDDKLNVNGGAIALGHPLGCTGAKLTATRAARAQAARRALRGRHDVHRRRPGRGRAVRTSRVGMAGAR